MNPAISCPHWRDYEKYCQTCMWYFMNGICTRDIRQKHFFGDFRSNRNGQSIDT